MDSIHKIDLVGCSKWTKVVQNTALVGQCLWMACYGWPWILAYYYVDCTKWPDAIFSRPLVMA